MNISTLPIGGSLPIEASTIPAAPSPAEALQGQMFDQLVSQSMTEMQKRNAEIKESLEKMNEE